MAAQLYLLQETLKMWFPMNGVYMAKIHEVRMLCFQTGKREMGNWGYLQFKVAAYALSLNN